MKISFFKKIFSGLMFGMILQLAIGPVCLYLINISIVNGFISGFIGSLGATLADSIFIAIGIIGISKLLNEKTFTIFKYFGGTVLVVFGIITILSFINYNNSDSKLNIIYTGKNVFWFTLILTLSSPLSIFFWSGIFGTKIIQEKYKKNDLICFSLGCLSATLIFLTFIVFSSALLKLFLTASIIKFFNIGVGIFIILFGVKLFLIKQFSNKKTA